MLNLFVYQALTTIVELQVDGIAQKQLQGTRREIVNTLKKNTQNIFRMKNLLYPREEYCYSSWGFLNSFLFREYKMVRYRLWWVPRAHIGTPEVDRSDSERSNPSMVEKAQLRER